MNRLAPPFRGYVTASAFVIDVAVVGEDEARRRVLAQWHKGCALRHVDAHRWLLVRPEPVGVRSELAPGLPLVATGDGYAPPGAEDGLPPRAVRLAEAGRLVDRAIASLPPVDVASWVDAGGLAFHALSPVEPPAPRPRVPEAVRPVEDVDLRAKAAVRSRTPRNEALLREIERSGGGAPSRPGLRGRAAGGAPRPRHVRDLLARMTMHSPVGAEVRRRHRKYLDELSERLGKGDYEALRDAIALGAGGRFMTLKLPPRRQGISGPSPRDDPAGGGYVPWAPSVWEHLNELYRATARRLEQEGRLDEAAFVWADLMKDAREAVALLERHGRYETAAEVAEGRRLDAATAVRLWWRAGRRDRAVEVARARSAFGEAVRRLEQDDPEAATALRGEWARSRAAAGDHVGAVEAGWPAPSLRPATIPWIEQGMALGGPPAARLFAYLLALNVTDEARAGALALVGSRDPATRDARDVFVETLRELPLADAASDREVTTAALRAVLRNDPPAMWADRTARDVWHALRRRADPLLREDLPTYLQALPPKPGATAVVHLPDEPGELPVHDVVPLPGAVLVAHGEHGTRLLGPDGRVRAHWDTPAHALVPADHGAAAVVATRLGSTSWELHRLDLVTRRLRPWFPLALRAFVGTYDGDLLPVIGLDGGIDFLDATADRPRVLSRELDQGQQVLAVSRSATSMAAVARLPHDEVLRMPPRTEVWQWELPGGLLRARRPFPSADPTERWVLTSDGRVAGIREAEPAFTWDGAGMPPDGAFGDVADVVDLLSSGPSVGLMTYESVTLRVDVVGAPPGRPDASLHFPDEGARLDMRAHGGLVAVWDTDGRTAVVDPRGRRVVAAFRTRA